MDVILDTHVWVWLVNGDSRIKKAGFLPVIKQAEKENSIKIPAICTWEISMLAAKGRITLTGNALNWINRALSVPGISICPLTPEIAYESSNLPGEFHGDPADRMIVASARILDATLLTFDQKILNYSRESYVNVLMPG